VAKKRKGSQNFLGNLVFWVKGGRQRSRRSRPFKKAHVQCVGALKRIARKMGETRGASNDPGCKSKKINVAGKIEDNRNANPSHPKAEEGQDTDRESRGLKGNSGACKIISKGHEEQREGRTTKPICPNARPILEGSRI